MLNLIVLAAVTATAGPATVKSGVERWRAGDAAGAVAAWLPFAAQGDADAMFNLGQAYKLGRGVTKDQNIARDYYRKAAAKGHLPAQANLGIALFQAGDKAEAVRWLQTAADRGEPRAQYVFGIAAYNGDGTPKNQGLAYGYLLRAKASGLAQAATALTSIEPQLTPDARAAGTAMAASMAAGTGVPTAIAAARPAAGGALRPAPLPTQVATATPPPRSILPTPAPGIVPRPPVPTTVPAPTTLPVPTTTQQTPVQTTAIAPGTPATPQFPTPTPPVRSAPLATADATPRPAPVTTSTVPVPVPRSVPVVTAPAPTPRPTVIAAAPSPAPDAAVRPDSPVKPPATVASRPKDWRVQLGAFSSKKLADEAWASIRKTQAAAIGTAKPIFDTSGPVVKFQLGPYKTRTAASDICAKLAFAGRACFVTQG